MGNQDYGNDDETFLGLETVTVGNKGSGAQYVSADQTAFNAAVTFLAGKGGGTIRILPGTLIAPTASLLINTSNIRVVSDPSAKVQLAQGVEFPTAIVSAGSQIWTQIFLVAAPTSTTITNIRIENLWIDDLNTITTHKGSVSGLVVGGGVDNLKLVELKTTNITRFARWYIGYAELVAGTTYSSGNITNMDSYHHVSDSCGQGGVGGTDGGHCKVSLVPTGATIAHWRSVNDYATNVFVIGMDFPVVNGDSTQIAYDFSIVGAHMEGSGANVQIGFFLESADTAGGQGSTQRKFVLTNCYAKGFAQGFSVDATWEDVRWTDCTADTCSLVGFHAVSVNNAGRTTLNSQNWMLKGFTAKGCPTGISLDSHAIPANTNFTNIVVMGGGTYDDGAAVVTTGIALRSAATKGMNGVYIGWYCLTDINGGTAVDTSAVTAGVMADVLIENCEGYGGLAYSLTTAFSRWASVLTAASVTTTGAITAGTTLKATTSLEVDTTSDLKGAVHCEASLQVDTTSTFTGAMTQSAVPATLSGLATSGATGQKVCVLSVLNKAETASADASVLDFTPPAVAGTYELIVEADIKAGATSLIVGFTISFTDANGQASGDVAFSVFQQATAAPALTFTVSARRNIGGSVILNIDNSQAHILLKWVGGGTVGTSTPKVSAHLYRIG